MAIFLPHRHFLVSLSLGQGSPSLDGFTKTERPRTRVALPRSHEQGSHDDHLVTTQSTLAEIEKLHQVYKTGKNVIFKR